VKKVFLFLLISFICVFFSVNCIRAQDMGFEEDLVGKWTRTEECPGILGGEFTYYMYFSNKLYVPGNSNSGYKFTWLPGSSGEEKGYYFVNTADGILTMVCVEGEDYFTFEYYYKINYDDYGPYSLELYPFEGNPQREQTFFKTR